MRGMLAGLVDELRTVGIPVSVGEHLDAARAVSHIPLRDREVLRAALQCALVKDADQLAAFNLIFDLYTAGAPAAEDGPLAGLSDDELREALRAAIAAGSGHLESLLAAEYVRRFAGFEPGLPVAGVMYARAVNEAADLESIRAGLLADGLAGAGGSGGAAAGAAAATRPAAARPAAARQRRRRGGTGSPGPRRTGPSPGSAPRSRPPSSAPWSPTAARGPSAPPCGSASRRTPRSLLPRPPSWRTWRPPSGRCRSS